MQRERNLYMFVYRMLLTSIYNGKYKFHEKLPSLSLLCEEYHVGRNTMRSALAKLQENGYVSLQKGVQPQVMFDVVDLKDSLRYRQALKNAMNMTKDVYATMHLILPDLFITCYQNGTIDLAEIEQLLKGFTIEFVHSEAQLIEKMYHIYLYVFQALQNPILVDLFYTLMSYAYQPLTPDVQTEENLQRSVKGIHNVAAITLKLAQKKQKKLVKQMISLVIKTHGTNSMNYLSNLCEGLEATKHYHFVWVSIRNHSYLYANVVVSIITDIVNGYYRIGDILPSISELSTMYDVSDRTTRKALSILREYHIIDTINGIGSKVVADHFEDYEEIIRNPEIKHNLEAYRDTLELFIVIFKKVLPMELKHISKDELYELSLLLKRKSANTLEPLSMFIFKRTNICLFTIFEELSKTLNWVTFANMLGMVDATLMKRREALIIALQNTNIKEAESACMDILKSDHRHIDMILQNATNKGVIGS